MEFDKFLQDNTKLCILFEHPNQHMDSWFATSIKLKETGLSYRVYIYDGGAQSSLLGKLYGFDKVVVLTSVHEEWMDNYLFLNVYAGVEN